MAKSMRLRPWLALVIVAAAPLMSLVLPGPRADALTILSVTSTADTNTPGPCVTPSLAGSDGGVFALGGVPDLGGMAGSALAAPHRRDHERLTSDARALGGRRSPCDAVTGPLAG